MIECDECGHLFDDDELCGCGCCEGCCVMFGCGGSSEE